MISTFIQRAIPFLRQLYVRVLLIAALSLVSVALAKLLAPIIPIGLAKAIGADAVDPILTTLASSMLAVTRLLLRAILYQHRDSRMMWLNPNQISAPPEQIEQIGDRPRLTHSVNR